MGLTDDAIAHFQKALEINSDDIGALHNLSFSLEQKGQRTDANSVLENALASAKSAGDEGRAEMIVHILAKLHETVDSSRVNLKARVRARTIE
jgi:tetratricopeptide (TPR) repeat protein